MRKRIRLPSTIYRDFMQDLLPDFEWRGNMNLELPDQ